MMKKKKRKKSWEPLWYAETASFKEMLKYFTLLPTEGDLFPFINKSSDPEKWKNLFLFKSFSFLSDVLLSFLKNWVLYNSYSVFSSLYFLGGLVSF